MERTVSVNVRPDGSHPDALTPMGALPTISEKEWQGLGYGLGPDGLMYEFVNRGPEIAYDAAMASRPDLIFATGRSDYPNQINNVLGFPYIFRGALDSGASRINEAMKLAAVHAIADLAKLPVPSVVNTAYGMTNLRFSRDYILPKPLDPRLLLTVAPAVARGAMESGVARRPITDWDDYEAKLRRYMGNDSKTMRQVVDLVRQEPKRVVFSEGNTDSMVRADGYNYKFHIDALEQSAKNSVYRNYSDGMNWTWNNTLTYMDTFAEKHNLTAMVGFTAEKYQDWWLNGSRQDIPGSSELLHEVSAGTGDQFASGSAGSTSLASFLGRVMYNYDQRYYLTASVRVDGSSRFPAGNKYGTFPSVSVAWRLSQEKFMEDTRDWLSNAKLRFGWGQVGNQAIGAGAYLTTIANVNYVFGNPQTRYPSTMMGSMGNPNLKWETVEDIDLGIDLSLFNSRLNVTADFYQKTSHDMLYGKQSQLIMGLPQWMGSVTQNIGSMRARGWELAVEWNDQVTNDFRYSIGVQLSGVKNKGLKFTGDGPILDGGGMPESIIRNDDNAPISRFFGYECLGIFQNWSQVYAHSNEHGALIQPDAQPGDLIFADRNHDGALNESDKTFLGNPYPDLNLGLNMSFWYKDFDLTANFYGTFGNDIFNIQKTRYSGGGGQNVYRGTLEKAWHYEGQDTDIPRLSYNDLNQNYSRVSSFFVEDGSYFRCKLLTLGYTLPKNIMKQYNLRFYVSAQNLFTITKYTGMDPEVPFQNGGAIATGIDYNNYPNPRTFLVGLDFKF